MNRKDDRRPQGLSIRDLEKAGDVPRSTIYFYVREGLLPVAQKLAASRAVYSEQHLELLREITRLKDEGVPLQVIRERLAPVVEAASAANADTAGDHAAQVRQAILTAAARLFPRKGYKGTRVSDIIQEVGITPPVFYSHFPSKQDLFVEAFDLFVEWMRRSLETRMPGEENRVERELSRVRDYYFGIKDVGFDMLSSVRAEAVDDESDLKERARDALKHMSGDSLDDLRTYRRENGVQLPLADELAAFGLFGAMDAMVMRACWDDRYSAADVVWTVFAFMLGVRAIYTGQLDVSDEVARYSDFIDQISEGTVQLPLDQLL